MHTKLSLRDRWLRPCANPRPLAAQEGSEELQGRPVLWVTPASMGGHTLRFPLSKMR